MLEVKWKSISLHRYEIDGKVFNVYELEFETNARDREQLFLGEWITCMRSDDTWINYIEKYLIYKK